MKKRFAALALILPAIIVVCWLCYPHYQFAMLRFHRKGTGDEARLIIDRMSSNKRFLNICLNDINLFGGSTRGWSSYAVRNSPRRKYVITRLHDLSSETQDPRVRIAALGILWDLEHKKEHLRQIFKFLKSPKETNSIATLKMARNTLAVKLSLRDYSVLRVNDQQYIVISDEEFEELLRQIPRDQETLTQLKTPDTFISADR